MGFPEIAPLLHIGFRVWIQIDALPDWDRAISCQDFSRAENAVTCALELTNSSYESAFSEGLFHACLTFGHSADLSLQKNFDNPRVLFTLLIAAGKNADTVCARFHWTFFLDLAMALV
jgi:hypothetical protein